MRRLAVVCPGDQRLVRIDDACEFHDLQLHLDDRSALDERLGIALEHITVGVDKIARRDVARSSGLHERGIHR